MRPVPIPDELVWDGARRTTLVRRDADLDDERVSPVPVEVIVDQDDIGKRMSVLIELETGDMERIVDAGGRFILMMYGKRMPIFALETIPDDLTTQ